MKTLALATFVVFGLAAGAANAQSMSYNAPSHNYHQNNWMRG